MNTKVTSIDDLEIGIPSIDLPPLNTESTFEDLELIEPALDISLIDTTEDQVIAKAPIKVKKKKPVVKENKTNVKESRYFWPDGTKKHYCVKCQEGPYRRDDEKVHQIGDHMIVCDTCYIRYYKIPEGKVAKGYKDHNYHGYEITPYKLPVRHGT